jgi:lambda family phage portal protein
MGILSTTTKVIGSMARAGVVKAYQEAGYIVPGMARKSMKGIDVRPNSPSVDIDTKLEKMRGLSRDFSMNNAIATAIFRRSKTNVAGAGLQVQPRVDREFLGLSDEQADAWNKQAIREYDLWSDNLEGDYTGMATPNELQGLMFLESMVGGDTFFALPWADSQRALWPYETTIKMIDADLVRNPDEKFLTEMSQSADAKIRSGIEYSPAGRLAAYWVANFYQYDGWDTDASNRRFERIPVYDKNGERQIFHLLEHERLNQRRGLPMLAPVVEDLKMISRLSKSELMSAVVASFFSVFVKDASGMGGTLSGGFTPDEALYGGGVEGPDDTPDAKTDGHENDLELGPGTISYLDDNKDIEIAETRGGKRDFGTFFEAMAVQVAAAAEIPYEVVMMKFERSYSAMRGAILEAWKRWHTQRELLAKRVCRPCYENVLREAVLKGRIQAPGFFDDLAIRNAWARAVWVGRGQGHVEPVKEATAAVMKIDAGLSTHEQEYALDKGGRWEPQAQRLAQERRLKRKLDIESTPAPPVEQGAQGPPDEEEEDGNEDEQ